MRDPAAGPALVRALGLVNTAARKAAATTLGGIGSKEALGALAAAAARDADPEVRRICAVLLG
jgi:HEAT repeat protein